MGLTQAVLLACLLLICLRLRADDTSGKTEASNSWKVHEWKLQTSLYTRHFKPDPRHNNHQKLIGIEAVCENDWLFGAAFFNNSFAVLVKGSRFMRMERAVTALAGAPVSEGAH